MRLTLLTSKSCAPCKVIKERLETFPMPFLEDELKIVDIDTSEGRWWVHSFFIRGVPALIEEKKVYMGLDTIMEKLGLE